MGPISGTCSTPHPCFQRRVFQDYVNSLPNQEQDEIQCFDDCPPPVQQNAPIAQAPDPAPAHTPIVATAVPGPAEPQAPQALAVPPSVVIHQPAPTHLEPQPMAVPIVAPAVLGPAEPQAPQALAIPPPTVIHQPTARVPLFLPERNTPSPPGDVDDGFATPPPSTENVHLSLTGWWLQVSNEIDKSDDESNFYLKAQNLDDAAQALIEFLVAIHSGQRNISRQRRDALKVRIQAGSSLTGLFVNSGLTFHVCVSD